MAADEMPILGHDEEVRILKQFAAQYDVPAYVRRALRVNEAFDQLLSRCQQERDERLYMVRLRLGLLHGLAGDWDRLRPWLTTDDQVLGLRHLHAILKPKLRTAIEPTSSSRALYRALWELKESIDRFNRRWQEFLQKVDLTGVNDAREGYNRYYLLEKECAIGSPRLARQGFMRLAPVTLAELAALLPPLPGLHLKG